MSVAYILYADHSPAGVASFVERLQSRDDRVFLHVDRRVDVEPFVTALAGPIGRGQVILVRRRVRSSRRSGTPIVGALAELQQALEEAPFTGFCLVNSNGQPRAPIPAPEDVRARAGNLGDLSQRSPSQSWAVSRDAAEAIVASFRGWRGFLRRLAATRRPSLGLEV